MAGQGIDATHGFRVVLVAAPESGATTVGVVVGRRGTETLLALMVACEQDLEEDGDQEEETRSVSIPSRHDGLNGFGRCLLTFQ